MKIQTLWPVAALALVCMSLAGCVNREGQERAREVEKIVADPTIPVETVEARSTSIDRTIALTGQITTDDEVAVSAKSPGRLSAVYVSEGSTVQAGQVLAVQEGREAQARLAQANAQVTAARSGLRQAQIDARVAPERSAAAVRASEARVRSARAALQKAIDGSRPEERAVAKANVDRAKSDLDTATKALERAQRLFEQGAIARAELEQAQNREASARAAYTQAVEQYNLTLEATRPEDIAQAREALRQAEEQLKADRANQRLDAVSQEQVASARAQLESAEEAVRIARIAVEDLTIRAPISGKVQGRPLQAGTVVSPGVTIATLIGSGGVYYEAEVPETDIASVMPGMSVDATVASLGDVQLSGQIVTVSPAASGLGRLYTVRIAINENYGTLKPGMFVTGRAVVGRIEDVVLLPTPAVNRDGENATVFLIENGKAKRIDVELVNVQGDQAAIRGVPEGAQVVVKGQTNLIEGTPVKLGSDAPDEAPEKEEGE